MSGVEAPLTVGPQAAWATAFQAAQAEFPAIGKDSKATIPTKSGGEYSYTYAALPDVLDAVKATLAKFGLSIAQSVAGDERSVAVETRIYHTSGWVETFGPLVLVSGGDARAAGSAITYARRYALCAALGIAPDEDDDGARAASARREEPTMSEADRAWQWVWEESKVYKSWSDTGRFDAAQRAIEQLGLTKIQTMDEAKKVFDRMGEIYKAEDDQTKLPV